jgi:hypothetical protein
MDARPLLGDGLGQSGASSSDPPAGASAVADGESGAGGDASVAENAVAAARAQREAAKLSRRRARAMFDIEDHFSLRSVLFRHEGKVVVNGVRHQLIFDVASYREGGSGGGSNGKGGAAHVTIQVKRASLYGGSVMLLKFLYMYIVSVLLGVAVAFCVLVLLQYMIGVLLVGVRDVKDDEERTATLLTLLALPSIVSALSMLLTLCIGFISDLWNDFEYLNTFSLVPARVRDWFTTISVFLVPLLTFAGSFAAGAEDPFTNMQLAALLCGLVLFALCVLYTLFLELYCCIKIVQACDAKARRSTRAALYRLLLHRLKDRFALSYYPSEDPDWSPGALEEGVDETVLMQAQLQGRLGGLATVLYNEVSPRRVWTLENVLKPRPILSKKEGSVLFLCCLTRSRFKGSLARETLTSSFVCVVLTAASLWSVLAGYLVYQVYVPPWAAALLGLAGAAAAALFVRATYLRMAKFKRAAKADLRRKQHMRRRLAALARERGDSTWSGWSDAEHRHHYGHQGGDANLASLMGSDSAAATVTSATLDSGSFFADPEALIGLGENLEDEALAAVSARHGSEGSRQQRQRSAVAREPRTPSVLNVGVLNRAMTAKERRYVYAEPKVLTALFLLALYVACFFVLPLYGFLWLNVAGYGWFFILCAVATFVRFLFNVPSLIEQFGPAAVQTLELPLLDFFAANRDGIPARDGAAAGADPAAAVEPLAAALHALEAAMGGAKTPPRASAGANANANADAIASTTVSSGSSANQEAQAAPTLGRRNSTLGDLTSPARQQRAATISSGGRRIYLLLTRMTKPTTSSIWLAILAIAAGILTVLIAVSANMVSLFSHSLSRS